MANECRLILIGTVLLLANRIGDVSTEDAVARGGSAAAVDVAADDAGQTRLRSGEENNQFIRKLFNKYGKEGVMTFEGLEHLLENLGLGNVHILDHDVHDHHTGEGFEEFHPSHEHNDTEDGWNRTNPAAQMQKQDGEHHRDDQRQHHQHHHHHKNQQQQQKGKDGRKGSKVKSNQNRTESVTSSHPQEPEDNKKGARINQNEMFRSGRRMNETSATSLPVDDSSNSDKKPASKRPCLSAVEMLRTFRIQYSQGIQQTEFIAICPALVYQLDEHTCGHPWIDPDTDASESGVWEKEHSFVHHVDRDWHCAAYHRHLRRNRKLIGKNNETEFYGSGNDTEHNQSLTANKKLSTKLVWLLACGAVVTVSLVGFLSVALVPLIGQIFFYNQLMQFLIAMAIGTLTGDAMLHLLPHAMIPHRDHSTDTEMDEEEDDEEHGDESTAMWMGLVALSAIFCFFAIERMFLLCSDFKKRRSRKLNNSKENVSVRSGLLDSSGVGHRLAAHGRVGPTNPKCILVSQRQDELREADDVLELMEIRIRSERIAGSGGGDVGGGDEDGGGLVGEGHGHHVVEHCHGSGHGDLTTTNLHAGYERGHDVGYAISHGHAHDYDDGDHDHNHVHDHGHDHNHVHDHGHDHNYDHGHDHNNGHGHGHGHGHSHDVPTTITSTAWMVIMGDGLHNFTDGLAIGASFTNSLAVGLSTSLAVFCHELPHELGDFAVLLKAGMSVKQALVCNLLSSVLCLLGMAAGVAVGNLESVISWIFSITAGIFIYIALVNMLPQITDVTETSDGGKHKPGCHLVLHAAGISLGIAIMLTIAVFEDSIQLNIDY